MGNASLGDGVQRAAREGPWLLYSSAPTHAELRRRGLLLVDPVDDDRRRFAAVQDALSDPAEAVREVARSLTTS
jgi:hypothetical protein